MSTGARVPGFFAGLTYPLRGMRFVFREHPSLVRFWIVPVLITFAAFAGFAWWIAVHHDSFVTWLWAPPVGQDTWSRVLSFAHGVATFAISVLIFAVGAIGILLASNVVAAPFNEALSAEVERLRGRLPPSQASLAALVGDLVRSVRIEVLKLLTYVALMAPLMLLNFVLPVIGSVLYAGVGFVLTIAYVAFDYTDAPAARRGVGMRQRLRLLRMHAQPMFGFGLTAWALLLVPGLNLFLMPAAVAGGTLLYLDLTPHVLPSEASEPTRVGPEFPG